MSNYNIVLSHGPVSETEYLGNDTVAYVLADGRRYTVRFSIFECESKKVYRRDVTYGDGKQCYDEEAFDIFDDGLTPENYAQWTADNFCEIDELVSARQ